MPNELSSIAEALERNNAAMSTRLDEIRTIANDAAGRLGEVEQVVARISRGGAGGGTASPVPLLVQELEKDDSFGNYRAGKSDRAIVPVSARSLLNLERRATTTTVIGGGAGDPTISQPDRAPGIAVGPMQSRWIWDLMPRLPANGSSVEFVRENAMTGGASAQTAEGATKAQTDFGFELINTPTPTVAHWSLVSRQALQDSAALDAHLRRRLLFGLATKLESYILVGDATNGAQAGLLHAGNFTAFSGGGPSDTNIDLIRRAVGQLQTAQFTPDIVALHPDAWTEIALLKDGEFRYLAADPKAASSKVLWGEQIYVTPNMPQGKFMVAALGQSTTYYERETGNVRLSDSDSDNFRKNLVTALAELRALAVVNLPAGIIVGDLEGAS